MKKKGGPSLSKHFLSRIKANVQGLVIPNHWHKQMLHWKCACEFIASGGILGPNTADECLCILEFGILVSLRTVLWSSSLILLLLLAGSLICLFTIGIPQPFVIANMCSLTCHFPWLISSLPEGTKSEVSVSLPHPMQGFKVNNK